MALGSVANTTLRLKRLFVFWTEMEHFTLGFGYKNGSNLRVVCWENNIKRNKTVPSGALIIAFDEETTLKAIGRNFNADDFGFTADWFSNDAQDNVRDELRSLNRRQDRVADITND